MFSTELGLEYKYDLSETKFKTAFEFLKRNDLLELPVGWIELGDGVRASIQRYTSFNEDEVYFESHEKYFDIQYVIKGVEYCGVCKNKGLTIRTPYSATDDITFYEDPEYSGKVLLEEGDFIVLAPEDVHKPRLAAGSKMEIRKVVIKVPVK